MLGFTSIEYSDDNSRSAGRTTGARPDQVSRWRIWCLTAHFSAVYVTYTRAANNRGKISIAFEGAPGGLAEIWPSKVSKSLCCRIVDDRGINVGAVCRGKRSAPDVLDVFADHAAIVPELWPELRYDYSDYDSFTRMASNLLATLQGCM